MAGDLNTISGLSIEKSRIPRLVKSISDIGIDFSVIAQRNSRTLEHEDKEIYDIFLANDIGLKETDVPYFDKSYERKVEYLRDIASNQEIEFIVHSVADELIVYDDYGYFCDVSFKDLKLDDKVKKQISQNFKKIYSLLGWSNGKKAWEDCVDFLTDGDIFLETIFKYKKRSEIEKELKEKEEKLTTLINELKEREKSTNNRIDENWKQNFYLKKRKINDDIINYKNKVKLYEELFPNKHRSDSKFYEENSLYFEKEDLIPVDIIGFEPIQANKLIPLEYKDKKDGRKYKIWKVLKKNQKYVILPDNAIVRISYSKVAGNKNKKIISYTERLIRNFNLTRKLEESRVAWNIMHSQFRMKMIIPISSTLTAKAKQALRQFTDKHKEELIVNSKSGQITVNGSPDIPYGKNIVIPNRQGNQPEVDTVSYTGPDLKDMDAPEYFRKNLWRDSYMPVSRFDRSGEKGQLVLFKADGVPYDEIAYNNFKSRIRKTFEEIIKKPLYLKTLLDFPELKIDNDFKNKIGLKYFDTSYFEEAREAETRKIKLDNLANDQRATLVDGRTPLYSAKFLYVTKYELMTEDEWETNETMRIKELKQLKDEEATANPSPF